MDWLPRPIWNSQEALLPKLVRRHVHLATTERPGVALQQILQRGSNRTVQLMSGLRHPARGESRTNLRVAMAATGHSAPKA